MSDNRIGKTVTEIPDSMLIRVDDKVMIINLGQVTIRDWMGVLSSKKNEEQFMAMVDLNKKILGDQYLDCPLVFMPYVNQRVMDAIMSLFTPGVNDDDSK